MNADERRSPIGFTTLRIFAFFAGATLAAPIYEFVTSVLGARGWILLLVPVALLIASVPPAFCLAVFRHANQVWIAPRYRRPLRLAAALLGLYLIAEWGLRLGSDSLVAWGSSAMGKSLAILADAATVGLLWALSSHEPGEEALGHYLVTRTSLAALILGGLVLVFKIGQAIYIGVNYSWMEGLAIQNGSELPPLWDTQLRLAGSWLATLAMVAAPYSIFASAVQRVEDVVDVS